MAKIIVIEDEPALRCLLAEELEHAGHDILEAGDGFEGLVMIMAEKPDLIISDIGMPIMGGYELKKLLQDCPLFGATPFMFLTALAFQDAMDQGLRIGADDYLTKPIDFDVLHLRIAACAAGSTIYH